MSDAAGIDARRIAVSLLGQVLSQKQPLDQCLDRDQAFNALEGRDRGFVRMVVATSLRHKGVLDTLLNKLQDAPRDIRPDPLKHILYVGLTQLLYMEVADHAAIDTTVSLAEALDMPKKKGFVNALLRRMQREKEALLNSFDPVQAAIPDWLLKGWIEDYGLKTSADIAHAVLQEAALDITVKDDPAYWAAQLQATMLAGGSLRLSAGHAITQLKGFNEGAWWVQDASAAIPARLLGDVAGKNVIDLCAAPGGKTAQLAAAGGNVTALDRSAKRLERLKDNMTRLGFGGAVTIVVGDGGVWQPPEPVDAVLLDAPCSATGTIRRHPDVMHLKTPEDVISLMKTQARLLENATKMLKPGGMLIYCTCSLQKSEGEEQIDYFLNQHPDFTRVPITAAEIGNVTDAITPRGDVRILPHFLGDHGGMDGFFIARLTRG